MKLKIEMILKYESAEARTTHERHRIRLLCQFLKGDNISTWKSLEIQCFSRNFDDYCESSQSINVRLTSKVFTLYKIKYSRRKKVLYRYPDWVYFLSSQIWSQYINFWLTSKKLSSLTSFNSVNLLATAVSILL